MSRAQIDKFTVISYPITHVFCWKRYQTAKTITKNIFLRKVICVVSEARRALSAINPEAAFIKLPPLPLLEQACLTILNPDRPDFPLQNIVGDWGLDQNELYHPPLLSKIEDLCERKLFGGRSL